MKLIDKYEDKGINRHTVWLFEENERKAGVDHNHDVLGGGYYCFPYDKDHWSHGEGYDTAWYLSLEEAKKVIQKYLSGEIQEIPTKKV